MTGPCGWAGAASQDAGVGLVAMLGAGINLVPPALTILGAGVLALGASPAVGPPWLSAAVLTATGAAAALLGAIAFHRRDVTGE